MSDHMHFIVKVQCVECGWTWEGWDTEAWGAMRQHITKPTEQGVTA